MRYIFSDKSFCYLWVDSLYGIVITNTKIASYLTNILFLQKSNINYDWVIFIYLINTLSGADLDRVHGVPEPCQRFQIYQIKGLGTWKNR